MKIKIFLFFLFFISCSDDEFIIELGEWKYKRMNALFAANGYLNLAGLYSLQSGEYTMGSSELNDFVFPDDFPLEFGKIYIKDSIISFDYFIEVKLKDSVKIQNISYNIKDDNIFFSWKSYQWFIHSDPGVKAIRLRNLSHPMLKNKLDIDFFPPDKNMLIKGNFIKYNIPKIRKSTNIIGAKFEEEIPGFITFKVDNKVFNLEPTVAPSGNFFIVFGDKTNGSQTYGGGRFLYVNPPDKNGDVFLNFNKAYNPPCVFSSFTTCAIPSTFNTLDILISAGEKNFTGISFSSVYE